MRNITIEPPPPMHDLQASPAPRESEAPTQARFSSGRPLSVQAVALLWSVARLPFNVLWRGDRFYAEYAYPFLKAIFSRSTPRQVQQARLATCFDCPFHEVKTRSRWAGVQVGFGAMLWGAALWWLIGPWLWLGGFAWSGFSWLHGDSKPAAFCGQCKCGTHGMAKLDFKVKRRGSACPINLWGAYKKRDADEANHQNEEFRRGRI